MLYIAICRLLPQDCTALILIYCAVFHEVHIKLLPYVYSIFAAECTSSYLAQERYSTCMIVMDTHRVGFSEYIPVSTLRQCKQYRVLTPVQQKEYHDVLTIRT